jgi:hypothetical protein
MDNRPTESSRSSERSELSERCLRPRYATGQENSSTEKLRVSEMAQPVYPLSMFTTFTKFTAALGRGAPSAGYVVRLAIKTRVYLPHLSLTRAEAVICGRSSISTPATSRLKHVGSRFKNAAQEIVQRVAI